MRARMIAMLLGATLMIACRGEPKHMQVEISLSGMVCESCVQAITHEVARLEGVRSIEVDLATSTAVVVYAEGSVDPAELEKTIEALGYAATPGEPVAAEP